MTHHSFWYVSPHQWPVAVVVLMVLAFTLPRAFRVWQRTRKEDRWYREYVRTHPYDPDSATAQRWRDEARRWREEEGLPEIHYRNQD